MSREPDFPLPTDLPAPADDGAADHLPGRRMPRLALAATDGERVNLAELSGRSVIYVYPMTGRPGVPLPPGWDEVPGARGCTPQSCTFRDRFTDFTALRCRVFGLSAQDSDYQREARDRLELPFNLLSDAELQLKRELGLPTFHIAGMELYKRLTLVLDDDRIGKVFYPIFPSTRNAGDVLAWLTAHPA